MKYKKFRQILAAALAAALLAGCGTPASDNGQSQNAASEASKSSAKTGSATVGELADYFVKAADGYNASVNREEILEGLKVSGKAGDSRKGVRRAPRTRSIRQTDSSFGAGYVRRAEMGRRLPSKYGVKRSAGRF